MRNNSKIAILLSFILGSTMLFAGCKDTNETLEPTPQSPTELEAEANKVYKSNIDKWLTYVNYENVETANVLNKSALTSKDTDTIETTFFRNDTTYKVTKRSNFYSDPSDDITGTGTNESILLYTEIEQSVYNSETGKCIVSVTSRYIENEHGKYEYKDKVTYDIKIEGITGYTGTFEGIIEVEKKVLVLRDPVDDEVTVEDTFANYVEKTTYTYYDFNGNKLAENLDTHATVKAGNGGSFLFSVNDTTYVMYQGEVLTEFKRGFEHDIPLYSKDNTTYAFFNYGGYNYRIIEQPYQAVQVGDFAMYTVPGMSIEILNDKYEIAVEYTTNSYAVMGYAVLPNGNVYICEYEVLSSDAANYDVLSGTTKLNVKHTVLDVKTGNTTSLNKDFVATKLYNGTTAEINSFINQSTMAEVLSGLEVKPGYMLAQVQKYSNGVLNSNSVYAVLDENLNIVQELPSIVPNQFGYVGFIEEDVMLINTSATTGSDDNNKSIVYIADTETGDLDLFIGNYKTSSKYEPMEGAFVYDGYLYDYAWNKLYRMDWGDTQSYNDIVIKDYTLNGDTIFVKDSYDKYYIATIELEPCYDKEYYDGSVQYEKYLKFTAFTSLLSNYNSIKSVELIDGNYYRIKAKEYYYSDNEVTIITDAHGKILFEEKFDDEKMVYESDSSYKYVKYSVDTEIYSISKVADGTYVMRVKETWEEKARFNYRDDEQPSDPKDGKTYYQYYILK